MPTSGRWVLHIDMDAFFASVEQLTRPTLRGRPVLVGGLGGRGVVAGASYEARAYGAHSAMPMARARRLMPPTAVTVSARKGIYGPVSRRVFSVIRERVPVVEQLSVDEAFMEPEELQGASKEQVIAWAEQLRTDIRRETGLASSIGAGAGKQFAKIASGLAKPDGVYVLDPARNHELLHPLPVEKLWGIGPVTAAKLHTLGVETIGDFAAMSQRDVEVSLTSKTGVMLWQLAQGTDDRPVKERDVAKSVSAEYTYPEDLESQAQLHTAVDRAGESAFRRLKKDGRGARTITCKVRLSDLSIHTRSETLAYATQDFDPSWRWRTESRSRPRRSAQCDWWASVSPGWIRTYKKSCFLSSTAQSPSKIECQHLRFPTLPPAWSSYLEPVRCRPFGFPTPSGHPPRTYTTASMDMVGCRGRATGL